MRYILLAATFAALALACSNSPAGEGQSAAPASEPLATSEAAPTPSSVASDGDAVGTFYYLESGEQEPSPRILPFMDPPPLDEEACEVYGRDDDGGLKVLAPGDPGYETRVSALIAIFQDLARLGTPTPEREEHIARIPHLSDCIERARG